jgi:hypothetical protein
MDYKVKKGIDNQARETSINTVPVVYHIHVLAYILF